MTTRLCLECLQFVNADGLLCPACLATEQPKFCSKEDLPREILVEICENRYQQIIADFDRQFLKSMGIAPD